MDLLLDPLKSELNWPMGTKRAIDLIEPSTSVICSTFLDVGGVVNRLKSQEIWRMSNGCQTLIQDVNDNC